MFVKEFRNIFCFLASHFASAINAACFLETWPLVEQCVVR